MYSVRVDGYFSLCNRHSLDIANSITVTTSGEVSSAWLPYWQAFCSFSVKMAKFAKEKKEAGKERKEQLCMYLFVCVLAVTFVVT